MVAESETTVSKRKIRELRVVDLRNELERRGLDKTGVKALLVDRLSKALQDEGHNADDYLFETTLGEKKPLKRNMGNHDNLSNPDSTHDGGDLSMTNDYDEDVKEDNKEETKKDSTLPQAVSNPPPAKEEATEVDSMPPPAPVPASSTVKVDTKHENNEVVEDSINLTLEDEENFEEEESHAQEKDEPRPPELTRSRGGSMQREEMITSKKSSAASVGSHGGSTGSGQTTSVSSTAASISDLTSYDAKSTCSSSTTTTLSTSQHGAADDGEEDLQHHSKHHHTNTSVDKESKMPSTMDNSASSSSSGEKAKSSTGSGTVGATKEGLTSSKITSVGNKDDRDKKNAGSANSSRNLWVSGMSMSTKANDLKHLFSKYGRVIGAKVVTNARTPGARCYGYVTMANSEDASKCIQHLHRTELHGRMISVERAKGENSGPRKATESKLSALTAESTSDKAPAVDSQEEASEKKAEDSQDVERPNSAAAESASTTDTGTAFVKDNEDGKSTTSDVESKSTQVQQQGQNRDERFKERERVDRRPGGDRRRPPSPHRPRPGVLTFQQIREERERHRQREREREEREADRRRREDMARQREQERKQREEAIRLEKERERLRIERERLEREKAELMRLERERQRLEREKIEQEREELKRQQARELARLEEVRRATKRPSVTERDADFYDRKRMAVAAVPSARYSSSQSRFEESKSSSHYSSAASTPAASDYRKVADRGYVDSRSRGERFDRTAGASSSSVVTRRVVEEVGPARRDARPPSSPPRERDDRRVVERVRDDRYDRSSRGSGSRDQSYSERDRERERERERERPRERVAGGPSERESARGRGMDRDHRTDRYPPDSRSKGNGSDHRFGERSGSDGGWRGSSSGVNSSIGVVPKSGSSYGNTGSSASNALLGNGGAASHHNPRESHHAWGAANDRNKTSGDGNGGHPSSVNTTTSWNSTTAPAVDRWGSSSSNLVSLGGGRAMASGASFASNWPNQSANPINSNVFTSNAALTNLGNVLGQSGSMNNYAADRYSRH